jgi:hypothetical protein
MAIEIGPGIIIGAGITIGQGAIPPVIFIATESSNDITTESGNNLITET